MILKWSMTSRCPLHASSGVMYFTTNIMLSLYLNNIKQSCFFKKQGDDTWLWYFRFGHLNFTGLRTLQQKNMVIGLRQISARSEICEEFFVSKQSQNSVSKSGSWRAKNALELIHSYISWLKTPSSNGGKSYIITYIDDFTLKSWVYFLLVKSEAFKSFKVLVEKEIVIPIKVLRSDRGGEYNSHEFASFFELHGIKGNLKHPTCPSKMKKYEKKSRTIMNMVLSILTSNSVLRRFLLESVNWTIHFLNRCPTLAVNTWFWRKNAADNDQP